MIGKQKTGKVFNGVLRYVLNPAKGHLIGGNLLGSTVLELSRELAQTRKLNPNLRKPVYHVSLSIFPGEQLNDAKWNEIAGRYMREMGFGLSQYCVVRHKDRDHDHIHIVANRIGLDGKTVSDSQNYRRSENVIRCLERDYGLTQVKSSREAERKALTNGELRLALKNNRPSTRMLLQAIIDEEAKKCLTMTEFAIRLRMREIEIIPNIATTGRISGLTYKHTDQAMKGSDLGKAYTFAGIQKRGIHYDIIRDRDAFNLSTIKPEKKLLNHSTNQKM